MGRREYLEEQIAEDIKLLKNLEDKLRTEIDPRLELRWTEDINKVKQRIHQREEELRSLSVSSAQPKSTTPVTPKFQKIRILLLELLANLSNGIRSLRIWGILFMPAIAWLIGHVVSLIVTGTSTSIFVVFGTVGGLLCIILVTWLGVSMTSTTKVLQCGKLIRLAIYFMLAGLVSGFVGLFLWLLGCNGEIIPMIRQAIGCHDTSKLLWQLVVGSSSLLALSGASFVLFIELGITRCMNRGL